LYLRRPLADRGRAGWRRPVWQSGLGLQLCFGALRFAVGQHALILGSNRPHQPCQKIDAGPRGRGQRFFPIARPMRRSGLAGKRVGGWPFLRFERLHEAAERLRWRLRESKMDLSRGGFERGQPSRSSAASRSDHPEDVRILGRSEEAGHDGRRARWAAHTNLSDPGRNSPHASARAPLTAGEACKGA
jgi:hypothetical protein